MPNFYCLDERQIWHRAACDAARRHGYSAKRIFAGIEVQGEGVGFIRPHADWRKLPTNRTDDELMRGRLLMIQDRAQVEVYEDKRAQVLRWGRFMPFTVVSEREDLAMESLEMFDAYPIVSKADVGASSVNVRILKDKAEAQRHIAQLFGAGISVNHGAHCPDTMQKGYALLQRFISHTTTWRVNAIGDARAVFKRYCYKDRPVAQTGNVDPTYEMDAELESLLDYADQVFAAIGSKWCALDILKDVDGSWKLLETSLAWPWPSPGDCDNGTIFRSGGKKWIQMFDVMFDQLQAGAWA